jgi:hypothetical protein
MSLASDIGTAAGSVATSSLSGGIVAALEAAFHATTAALGLAQAHFAANNTPQMQANVEALLDAKIRLQATKDLVAGNLAAMNAEVG